MAKLSRLTGFLCLFDYRQDICIKCATNHREYEMKATILLGEVELRNNKTRPLLPATSADGKFLD